MPFTTALVMGGVGALSGNMQARAQAKANEKANEINAAQTRFSPWTGITPQGFTPQAVNATGQTLSGGVNGGLAGLMMAQANKKPPLSPEQAPATQVGAQSPWMDMSSKKMALYQQPLSE